MQTSKTDRALTELTKTKWKYAAEDPGAVASLSKRLTDAARDGKPISYSDLVRGVDFVGGADAAKPTFQIDVHDWRDFDRALVGDLLGFISSESYRSAGFMLSALAVSADDGVPGEPSRAFYAWCRKLGLIKRPGRDPELEFWIDQLKKAQAWAKARKK